MILLKREREAMAVTSSVLGAGYPLPNYCKLGKWVIDQLLKSLELYSQVLFFPDDDYYRYRPFDAPSIENVLNQGPGAVPSFFYRSTILAS
jgi:hypothetical protein